MLDSAKQKELEIFAAEIRLETIKELASLGLGHVGGAMSMVETLAVLYGDVMKIDPQKPDWEERDWFVLSKGHAGPSLYATLALKGYFPLQELNTLNRLGTRLPSHASRVHTPGIDISTGSLGQGASTAAGVAVASKQLGADNTVYLMLGDGECDEGQVWECALFAGHHKLDNLIAFVDYNKKQLDGTVEDVCALGDIAAKFVEFGWHAQEVDGHDVSAIYDAIETAKEHKGKPSMIVLNTVKGKGCGMAEAVEMNHHLLFMDKEAVAAELKSLEDKLSALKNS